MYQALFISFAESRDDALSTNPLLPFQLDTRGARNTALQLCPLIFLSSGRWKKIKLKLITLPGIFIRVVYQFNSNTFAIQRKVAYPSVPVVATARAVPTGGHRYHPSSSSCRFMLRMLEYVDPT